MFPLPSGLAIGKPPVPLFEHQAQLIQGATIAHIRVRDGTLDIALDQLSAR